MEYVFQPEAVTTDKALARLVKQFCQSEINSTRVKQQQ